MYKKFDFPLLAYSARKNEPEWIKFFNKNKKKMTIDLFKSSNGPIEFFKGKEIFDCLEEIWEYAQEEKDKIIWSNPRNF